MTKEEIIREYIGRRSQEDLTRYGYIADYYNKPKESHITENNKKYLITMFFNPQYQLSILRARLSSDELNKKLVSLNYRFFSLIKNSSEFLKEQGKIKGK